MEKNTSQSRRTRQADTCFVQTATIIPTFQQTWTRPVTVEIKQGHVVRNSKEGPIQSDIVSVQDTRNIWKKQSWTTQTMRLTPDNGASFVNDIAHKKGKMVCDGSFKFGRSSSAFLSISKENFIGTNIVPGRIEDCFV